MEKEMKLSDIIQQDLAYHITAPPRLEEMYLTDEKISTPKVYGQSKRKTHKNNKRKILKNKRRRN